MKQIKVLKYYVNLDERGEYFADIRDENENTLLEIDTEYAQFLTDENVKLHNLTSVWNYFRSIGMIPGDSILTKGN